MSPPAPILEEFKQGLMEHSREDMGLQWLGSLALRGWLCDPRQVLSRPPKLGG